MFLKSKCTENKGIFNILIVELQLVSMAVLDRFDMIFYLSFIIRNDNNFGIMLLLVFVLCKVKGKKFHLIPNVSN